MLKAGEPRFVEFAPPGYGSGRHNPPAKSAGFRSKATLGGMKRRRCFADVYSCFSAVARMAKRFMRSSARSARSA